MEKEYTRLPGRRMMSAWGTDSLWLGKDHLLSIKKRGYVEEYKRFYFQDVQTIAVHQTGESLVWNILFGSLFGILCFFFVLAWRVWEWETGGLIAWGILTGLFLVALLINIAKGPICSCSLSTAVQSDPLPSLHRVRTALKVIRIVRPHVEAAQGAVSREQLFSIPFDFIGLIPELPRADAKDVRRISGESGGFHLALFGFLLLNAVLTSLDFFYRSMSLYVFGMVIWTCILIAIIGAAIRQRNSDMSVSLKRNVWFSLALLTTITFGSYFHFILFAIRNPQALLNRWGIIESVMKTAPQESTFSTVFHVFSITGSSMIGIAGMILLWKYWRSRRLEESAGG